MSKELKENCPSPRVNKLLIILLFVFLAEAIYIGYIKDSSDKGYELLIQLKSLNIIHQKIDIIFDIKNNYQSYDEIVKNTQQFNAILNKIQSYANQDTKMNTGNFSVHFKKLQNDWVTSQEYVERYKSWNSLTVNSTRLIYDMHEHVQKLINENKVGKKEKELIRLLDGVIRMISLLNYDGLSEINVIRSKAQAIKEMVLSSKVLSEAIKQLYKHIEVLFEGHEIMQALKEENKNLYIDKSIESLHTVLLNNFKRQDSDNSNNILVSNILITMLFVVLFFTNKKEAKLHYRVCNMNYELEANINELESVNNDMTRLMDKLDKNVISSKTDVRGVITYVSHAFCKISGYSEDELIGKTHNIVRHSDTPKDVFRDVWATIQSGKEWRGEIKNATKSNGYYWVDVTISPEFNDDGSISGYSAIRHEITDKKKLEVLSDSLEDQVRFRTKELEEMVKKVENLSITDELTQLHNRRYYSQNINIEIKRAERNALFFNYVLIDIDYFKRYNDTYGHQLGDVALKEVAAALTSMFLRPSDFIFRMGGEEFVAVFTSENKEKAVEFSQKIIDKMSSLKIEHLENPPFNVLTVSGGLVSYEAEKRNMDESLLYKKADELLYMAKNEGRNRIKY